MVAVALGTRRGRKGGGKIGVSRFLQAARRWEAEVVAEALRLSPELARALWHSIARGCNRALARALLRMGANPDFCLWAVVWEDDVMTARRAAARVVEALERSMAGGWAQHAKSRTAAVPA